MTRNGGEPVRCQGFLLVMCSDACVPCRAEDDDGEANAGKGRGGDRLATRAEIDRHVRARTGTAHPLLACIVF